MKLNLVKLLLTVFFVMLFVADASAQRRGRNAQTRDQRNTTTEAPAIAVDTPVVATSDSLPIRQVKKTLRRDDAVEMEPFDSMLPLPYEHLREADAVYRHKIWRDIDIREKLNLPFRYAADDNNGNQRFISILLQAVQDSAVTVFAGVDDRFTTPMTKGEVATAIGGPAETFDQYDENGNVIGTVTQAREINLDSITKFRIKEEVIFDKESSRLFWRILGIAPVIKVPSSMGLDLGEVEAFWVYYPDMRPIFGKYKVYNGKNFGARMTWEELFESRMFASRIVKSTINNPYDMYIKDYRGMRDNKILQLYESESMKEDIFNYEQDLWSY